MNTADVKRHDVRRQAEDRFAKIIKRDAEVMAYQKQQWDAESAKIARLRALRMARDAGEDAEHRAGPQKANPAGRTKPARSGKIPKHPKATATSTTSNKA